MPTMKRFRITRAPAWWRRRRRRQPAQGGVAVVGAGPRPASLSGGVASTRQASSPAIKPMASSGQTIQGRPGSVSAQIAISTPHDAERPRAARQQAALPLTWTASGLARRQHAGARRRRASARSSTAASLSGIDRHHARSLAGRALHRERPAQRSHAVDQALDAGAVPERRPSHPVVGHDDAEVARRRRSPTPSRRSRPRACRCSRGTPRRRSTPPPPRGPAGARRARRRPRPARSRARPGPRAPPAGRGS